MKAETCSDFTEAEAPAEVFIGSVTVTTLSSSFCALVQEKKSGSYARGFGRAAPPAAVTSLLLHFAVHKEARINLTLD